MSYSFPIAFSTTISGLNFGAFIKKELELNAFKKSLFLEPDKSSV